MITKRPAGRLLGFGLAALLALGASAASAHHGWSWYGEDPFELTGRIIETHFGNPHDRLTVESDGKMWNVMLSPPARSQRAGFNSNAIKAGDMITAYGHRRTEGETSEMKTERIRVGDNTYDLYPDRL
jgi:hypothetical protein